MINTQEPSGKPGQAPIRQYARWVHLNRMHHLVETSTLKPGTLLAARQSTSTALEFLRFLHTRNTVIKDCSQHDIDAWLAGGLNRPRFSAAPMRVPSPVGMGC